MDKSCIACGGKLHSLGIFHDMPASAQDIPDLEEIKTEKAIELNLCQCESCGLVQFPVEPVHYYKDVIRAGGGTKTMTRLRHEEYRRLLSYLMRQNLRKPRILEVGCGRGEFLEMWKSLFSEPQEASLEESEEARAERWAAGDAELLPDEILKSMKPEILGIEHQSELVKEAVDKGLSVFQGFSEKERKLPGAPLDAFVQFNFLEHQPDPLDMLRTIHKNLRDGGLGLITVPSFEYILEHNGYYELLRDHIANYTEETLQNVLQKTGFEVLEMRIVNRDTIEAIVRKENPEKLSSICFNGQFVDISPLLSNYEQLKKEIRAYLASLKERGGSLAIWGASHQGFTLAASTELNGMVRYIIDSAKFKQGRFSPASHIPIVAPEHFFTEPVDEILIVAPGYTDEIAGIIRERFGEKVKILMLKGKRVESYS